MADVLRTTPRRSISAAATLRRYRRIPAAVLLAQLFLAAGWLRAAAAHGLTGGWWRGDDVVAFVEAETDRAVWFYRPLLDHVVASFPTLTAIVVIVVQVVAGIHLALNRRPLAALAGGVFLNLNFILAGVVNPSAFYLVISLIILVWRMERTMSLATSRRSARGLTWLAGVVTVLLAPSVDGFAPDHVIEDPALMLMFLSILTAVAAWWTAERIDAG